MAEPAAGLGPADVARVLCAAELSIGRRGARTSCSTRAPPSWSGSSWPATPPSPDEPHRGMRLLPYFDAFVVAGQPRQLLYPGAAAQRTLTPAGQAGNYPVLLIDGVVGGVWHQKRSGRKLAVTAGAHA
jgi:hypothetical protein